MSEDILNKYELIDSLIRPEGIYGLWENKKYGDLSECIVTLDTEIHGKTRLSLVEYIEEIEEQ